MKFLFWLFLVVTLCSAMSEEDQDKITVLQNWIKQIQQNVVEERESCSKQFNDIGKEFTLAQHEYARYLKDKELWQTQYNVYQSHLHELHNCKNRVLDTVEKINEIRTKIYLDVKEWMNIIKTD